MKNYTDNELFNDMANKADEMIRDKELGVVLICEVCDRAVASKEYLHTDEDGDVFYTYRCNAHPLNDPEYYETEVS